MLSSINFRFNVSQCNEFQLLSPMQPTSRWNNRNGWRNMERRLHCLEGRSTQGRCRQAGEAGLCQGQENNLAKLVMSRCGSPRVAIFRVSITNGMTKTFTKLGLHLFDTKSLNQTWTPFVCWEYFKPSKHSHSPDFLDALASLKTMLDIKWVINSLMFSRFQDWRVLESITEC